MYYKTRKILSLYAKHQKRNEKGQFIKETLKDKEKKYESVEIEMKKKPRIFKPYIERIEEKKKEIKEKIEVIPEKKKHKIYKYFIGATYDKRGKKGEHPFHMEFKVDSPKPLSIAELEDIIIREVEQEDDKLAMAVRNCKFAELKTVEIETVEFEPSIEVYFNTNAIKRRF